MVPSGAPLRSTGETAPKIVHGLCHGCPSLIQQGHPTGSKERSQNNFDGVRRKFPLCPSSVDSKDFAVDNSQVISRRKAIGGIQNGCPAPTNNLFSSLERQRTLVIAHAESSYGKI